VKVRHDEGVANHIGPEPCVGVRKDVDEASVGEGIGQPLSHEIRNPGADAVSKAEGNIAKRDTARLGGPGGVEEPGMCRSSLSGNREVPGLASAAVRPLVRIGKARSRSQ